MPVSAPPIGPKLVDGVRDRNELPGRAVVLRVEKGLLEPGELRGTEVGAIRVVSARSGVIRGGVGGLQPYIAVRAGVGVDEERVPAPLNG